MKKTIWFIRHGESESNAGLPSIGPADIPLTQRGIKQAELIASQINNPPDLFVTSPYIRTVQTFEPTRKKFPNVLHETWEVQEYTYLPQDYYLGTTTKQRFGPSRRYFQKGDPDYIIGEGGESFNQFRKRVITSLHTFSNREESFVIVFGHGWFMRCILWELIVDAGRKKYNRLQTLTSIKHNFIIDKIPYWSTRYFGLDSKKRAMIKFLIFSASVHVPNGSILKLDLSPAVIFSIKSFEYNHIPPNLRGVKHIDR